MSVVQLHSEPDGVVMALNCFGVHEEHLLPENEGFCDALNETASRHDYGDLMYVFFFSVSDFVFLSVYMVLCHMLLLLLLLFGLPSPHLHVLLLLSPLHPLLPSPPPLFFSSSPPSPPPLYLLPAFFFFNLMSLYIYVYIYSCIQRNTTFGLVPAGRQPATYRLAEVMSAGAIPVFVARDMVRPFPERVDWPSLSFSFSPEEVGPTMMAVLRSVQPAELLAMQVCG